MTGLLTDFETVNLDVHIYHGQTLLYKLQKILE